MWWQKHIYLMVKESSWQYWIWVSLFDDYESINKEKCFKVSRNFYSIDGRDVSGAVQHDLYSHVKSIHFALKKKLFVAYEMPWRYSFYLWDWKNEACWIESFISCIDKKVFSFSDGNFSFQQFSMFAYFLQLK